MSASFEKTIGATATDQVNKGEALSRVLRYLDDAGDPVDITGGTFTVTESFPSSIATNMVLTIIDAAAGTVLIALSAAHMADLTLGRTNWFRVKNSLTGDVTPRIWIQIT